MYIWWMVVVWWMEAMLLLSLVVMVQSLSTHASWTEGSSWKDVSEISYKFVLNMTQIWDTFHVLWDTFHVPLLQAPVQWYFPTCLMDVMCSRSLHLAVAPIVLQSHFLLTLAVFLNQRYAEWAWPDPLLSRATGSHFTLGDQGRTSPSLVMWIEEEGLSGIVSQAKAFYLLAILFNFVYALL